MTNDEIIGEVLEHTGGIIYPELEFALIGTVRRCGTADIAAYNYNSVMEYLLSEYQNEVLARLKFKEHYNQDEEFGPMFIEKMSLDQADERFDSIKICSGLDDAFIGVGYKGTLPPLAVYSYEGCVKIKIAEIENCPEILSEDYNDPRDIAIEDMEYNTLDAYVGEDTPFFLENEI
jgi:hypothetical protein